MSHGFVSDWHEEYRYASEKRRKKMDKERKKEHKKFIKKYDGLPLRTIQIMTSLDDMEELSKSGILQAVKEYGDKALIFFQKKDNKKWEKENE